jgi:hypothetical protein
VRLTQLRAANGERMLAAASDDGKARRIDDVDSTYALAARAIAAHSSIAAQVAALGLGDGIKTQDGDVFEIEAEPFGLPLRNAWHTAAAPAVTVRNL